MNSVIPIRLALSTAILFSLFFCFTQEGKGKSSKADSLWTIVENSASDTIRINALRRLTRLTMHNDPDSAQTLIQQAYRLAKETGENYWKAKINNLKGEVFRTAGQLDSAKHYFHLARKQASSIDDQKTLGKTYSNLGIIHELQSDYEKAEKYHYKSLEIWKKKGKSSSLGKGYINLGVLFHRQGKFEKALENYFLAVEHFKKADRKRGLSQTYNNIGGIYWNQGNYPKALDHFLKSLKIKKEIGDQRGIATAYSNIGNIYDELKDYPKAREYYENAIQMNKQVNNQWGLINCYSSLALLQEKEGAWDAAFENLKKSIRLSQKMGDQRGEARNKIRTASMMLSIATKSTDSLTPIIDELSFTSEDPTAFKKELLDSSQALLTQAGSLLDSIEDPETKALLLLEKGNLLKQLGQPENAEPLFETAYQIAHEKGMKKVASGAIGSLAKVQYLLNKHQAAYENQSRYLELKEELLNENKSKEIGQLETQYVYEKKLLKEQKEKEKQKALAKARSERQSLIITAVSSGLGLVVLFSIFLFNRFRVIRKQKGIIEEQKQKVDAAFDELHEKNKEITDSIQYASRIQEAILTSKPYRERAFREHFIFFQPKDIVSGDFYWVHHDEEQALTFWLAADCTGHGVPGAFMSMIGNRLFNEVVIEQGETDPGRILDKVREGIVSALGQSGEEDRKDGMDAALCVFEKNARKVHFAGANNPLYLIGEPREAPGKPFESPKDTESSEHDPSPTGWEIKADKQPIGQPEGEAHPFTTKTIHVQPGDVLYTFSDGFADQFGGPKGKKYRYMPFKKLLLNLQQQPLNEQERLLRKEFEQWRGEQEQLDDIVVIGVGIP